MRTATSWHPIVIGFDASKEAAQAADFGRRLAAAAGTTCHVVHAAPDEWAAIVGASLPGAMAEYRQALVDRARQDLALRMEGLGVPRPQNEIGVRLGPPARVLQEAVDEVGAELVVLGGKHHPALQLWLGGSTALNAVRALDVPVLVTRGAPPLPARILVAADISAAAGPTFAAADRLARLVGAQVRALSVLMPIEVFGPTSDSQPPEYYALWEEMLQRDVWPLIESPGTETVVRHGAPAETIEREVAAWGADLLVVGSHGKGWVDRLLIGSVTERLLNRLPTSLLVVPVASALEGAVWHAPHLLPDTR